MDVKLDLTYAPDLIKSCFPKEVEYEYIETVINKSKYQAWVSEGGSLAATTKIRRHNERLFPYILPAGKKAAGVEGFRFGAIIPIVLLIVIFGWWFNSVNQSFHPAGLKTNSSLTAIPTMQLKLKDGQFYPTTTGFNPPPLPH